MEKLIWQIYACVYDLILERFIPYRQMIDKVVTALDPGEDGVYLDAGCGTGNLIAEICRRSEGAMVTGIDFSSAMLKRAEKKLAGYEKRVVLESSNLNRPLKYDHEVFDGLVCINVLYILNKPADLLNELNRVLKKNGKLILATPYQEPKLLPVIHEHIAVLKQKKPKSWLLFLIGQLTLYVVPVIVFSLVNLIIIKNKKYFFFDKDQIQAALTESGFMISDFDLIYGGQIWFLAVIKN